MATTRLQTTALGMVETRGLVASVEAAEIFAEQLPGQSCVLRLHRINEHVCSEFHCLRSFRAVTDLPLASVSQCPYHLGRALMEQLLHLLVRAGDHVRSHQLTGSFGCRHARIY